MERGRPRGSEEGRHADGPSSVKRQSVGTWAYEEYGVKQAQEWPEEKILEAPQPAPDSVVALASRR